MKSETQVCRYCKFPVDNPIKTLAYWGSTPDICHAECKRSGEISEALECQLIDADCNDCKHYKRGKLAAKIESQLRRKDGTVATITHQPNIFKGGTCCKFNRPADASPNKWSGLECFEHRKN